MSKQIAFSRRSVLVMVVLGLSGAALGPSAAYADESTSQSADEMSVRSLLTQIGDAWNAGDGSGTAQPFAENGELISADGTHWRGRSEIAKYMSRLVTGSMKGSRFIAEGTEVRFLTPQVAIMHSRASFVMSGGTEPERYAVLSIVAVRNATSWHVALFQSTRARAPGAAPGQ